MGVGWIPGVMGMTRTRTLLCAAVLSLAAACQATSPAAPGGFSAGGVAPSITEQPSAQTIQSGQSTTLSVTAAGDAPMAYQWFAGPSGVTTAPVAGAASRSFVTPVLDTTAAFWVRVSNAAGAADSAVATITVVPPPAPSAPEPDPAVPGFEDTVLTTVNYYRAAGAVCGSTAFPSAQPLQMSDQLRGAAHAHSEDMAAHGYFSHTSPDGRTFSDRIRATGYASSPIAENIAAGYDTPQSVVAAWMSSPGHCANIMSPGFRAIGVGYAFRAGSPYEHYWTQDFGGS